MVIRDSPVSCITCLMRRNFMLIFPVMCRFVASPPLTLEVIISTGSPKSHPRVSAEFAPIPNIFFELITL